MDFNFNIDKMELHVGKEKKIIILKKILSILTIKNLTFQKPDTFFCNGDTVRLFYTSERDLLESYSYLFRQKELDLDVPSYLQNYGTFIEVFNFLGTDYLTLSFWFDGEKDSATQCEEKLQKVFK